VEVREVAEPDEKEVLVMDVEMGETKKRKIKKLEKKLEKQKDLI
jgi:hypothetical protein